jgi:hypothetical protein
MFTVSLISGVELADILIKLAQRDQRVLDARITNLSIRNENSSENSAEYTAEVAELTAGIQTSTTILATLPEGKLKEEEITKKMEMELRLRKLTTSEISYTPESVLEREYTLAKLVKQREAAAEFEAAVTARKAEL